MPAIAVEAVHKRFASLRVLEGINLSVARGEVYGLLGPNGAGKSTLIHLLLGLLHPDAGSIRVLGLKPSAAVPGIGYLPEHPDYFSRFTPMEHLRLLGRLNDMGGTSLRDRCMKALRTVGLANSSDRPLGVFSKGMLQRFGVAQAILHEPELLVIDEPTSGLDPAGQREVHQLLAGLRAAGHTIFLCTHQVAEVEGLCDRFGILVDGRLAIEAGVQEPGAGAGIVVATEPSPSEDLLSELSELGDGVKFDGREIRVGSDPERQRRALRAVLDGGFTIREVKQLGTEIEDLYWRATREPGSAPSRAGDGSGAASEGVGPRRDK